MSEDILDRLRKVEAACTQKTFLHSPDWLEGKQIVQDAIAEIERLRRDNARSSEHSRAWQPIETAPRDGRRLLGTGGGLDDTVEVISYNGRVGAWDTENYTLDDRDDEAEGYNRPSHWQPMPSAHVSEAKEGGQ